MHGDITFLCMQCFTQSVSKYSNADALYRRHFHVTFSSDDVQLTRRAIICNPVTHVTSLGSSKFRPAGANLFYISHGGTSFPETEASRFSGSSLTTTDTPEPSNCRPNSSCRAVS